MVAPLSAALRTRLEKTATDNGFDLHLPPLQGWLAFASSQAPLLLWLAARDGTYVAALSQLHVARAFADHGTDATDLPPGARAARAVQGLPDLHKLLRRAFQLSRTLPQELYQAFAKQTHSLPRATEAERLVLQRVGQDLFRRGLLDYWDACCAITGLATKDLLRASHIKPWAHCDSDPERLDIFNGLLLAPHLDCAFDQGFITLADDGAVQVSPQLPDPDRRLLGLDAPLRVHNLADGHRLYLPWHRQRVFRPGS